MSEGTVTQERKASPDEMLFHDLVAVAARVQDEADRVRALSYAANVTQDVAHQAGIAYAKLDTLESAMFDAVNSLAHQASDVAPTRARDVAGHWHEQKQACRKARREARRLVAKREAAA